ncbi:MAG: AI-2E family transporter [Chloroflexota bacterium]|nr:AI-2E family transporter [Chloroflexota bacterium]
MAEREAGPSGPGTQTVRTVRIELSLRSVLSIVAVAVGLWMLIQIWPIIVVLVIALVLAGTLSPIVDRLERRGIRRIASLALVLLALALAVVGLGFLVIPALVGQVRDVIARAPAIQAGLADFLARYPPLAARAEIVRTAEPERYLAPVGASLLPYAQTAAQTVVEFVAYALTTAVLAFYLIADRERVLGFVYALLPRRFHLRVARILLDMETIVGGYVRGQAITSLCMGLFAFALLRLLGVPNALALAILAAFTDLIPFIGSWLATTPAVLAALSVGPGQALIVLVSMVLYQEFESRVLIPRVYGQTLRLSPVAVMVALLVGGKLLGVVGALLALPITAGLRVVVAHLRIDLPGEQPGEPARRAAEDHAEAFYAERTADSSAVEAAVTATALADAMQDEREAETGRARNDGRV